MNNVIKVVLAILFFLCLLDMPYGYYEMVRFLALLGFALLAIDAYKQGNETLAIVFAALALLFQPFFKVALGRTLWNVVDVVVGAYLLFSLDKKKD